jgi:hypothetical protein
MREFTAVIIYTGGQYKGSPTNIIKNKLLCFEGEFIMLKIKKNEDFSSLLLTF